MKNFYFKKGFTLMELLIVIALIAIFVAMTVPFTMDFYKEQVVEEQTANLANNLKVAQSHAQSGKNNSSWGIKFFEDEYVLFMGDSYSDAERNTDYDKTYSISSGVTMEGVSEIVFEKGTGNAQIIED
jgi:prepilin-type N-terminal cleavage/methylation domain-containing protein